MTRPRYPSDALQQKRRRTRALLAGRPLASRAKPPREGAPVEKAP